MSELVDDLKLLRRLWLDGAPAWGTSAEWERVTNRLFPEYRLNYPEKVRAANALAEALGWSVAA